MTAATYTPRSRDRNDLAALYEREVDTVFGFLLARCGNRHLAEDLTTETFINAADRFAQGRGREVTGAWLMTAARRRLVDHWRRAASQRDRVDRLGRELGLSGRAAGGRPTTAPDEHILGGDERVLAALDALPDRQRAALAMRYIDEMSVSEVAAALDTSYQSTESLLARARRSFTVAFEANP